MLGSSSAALALALAVLVCWRHKITPFKVLYFLYVNTPVGTLLHHHALKTARGKPPHTRRPRTHAFDAFSVVEVPLLSDNYSFLLVDHETGRVAAVDPCDAQRVAIAFEELKESWPGKELKLTAVLCTHKHLDHAGGNTAMSARFPGLDVVGGRSECCQGTTIALAHRGRYRLGNTLIEGLLTPCHTKGHLCFLASPPAGQPSAVPILFTGDLLFVGGCGKFFEGDGQQAYQSLCVTIAEEVDSRCKFFCGHEYTVSNLRFAAWLEPDNDACATKLRWAEQQRAAGESTLPGILAEEKAGHNPFLRVSQPEVVAAVTRAMAAGGGVASGQQLLLPGEVMTAARELKDKGAHVAKEKAK